MYDQILKVPFWNNKEFLVEPAMAPQQLLVKARETAIKELLSITENFLMDLRFWGLLIYETRVLFAFKYRMKRVFRNDKILSGIKKITQCLLKILTINNLKSFIKFRQILIEHHVAPHVLVMWSRLTLQRLATLYNVLIKQCISLAPALERKLSTGHHWKIVLMVLSVVGRIWTLAIQLCIRACKYYKNFGTYEDFADKDEDMASDDLSSVELPEDLVAWLGNPAFLLGNKKETQISKSRIDLQQQSAMEISEDLGEIVPREEASERKPSKPKKEKRVIHFKTPKQVLEFVEKIRKKATQVEKEAGAVTLDEIIGRGWKKVTRALLGLTMQLSSLNVNDRKKRKVILHKANQLVANVNEKLMFE